jgi:hypothetical protein
VGSRKVPRSVKVAEVRHAIAELEQHLIHSYRLSSVCLDARNALDQAYKTEHEAVSAQIEIHKLQVAANVWSVLTQEASPPDKTAPEIWNGGLAA